MTDAVPTHVLKIQCWNCKAKGLWKPLPYREGKPTTYTCQKCGNTLEEKNDKN